MQSAHPRDLGALALVVGLFLILFVVTVMLGSPARDPRPADPAK